MATGGGGGGGLQPFFTDDFSNGVRNDANGFSWLGTDIQTEPRISNERSFSGSHSMRFQYNASAYGGQGWTEERFDTGRYLSELAMEYMLYVPANYKHRVDPNTGGNNKFFSIWRDTYGGVAGSWEISVGTWRTSDTVSNVKFQSTFSARNNVGEQAGRPNFMGAGSALVPGQWNKVQFYVKAATERAGEALTADGIMQMFINDALFFSFTTGDFNNFNPAFIGTTLRNGYLLGYSNSGFDENTVFFIDDFKIWDGRPSWALAPVPPLFLDKFSGGTFNSTSALTWGSPQGGASVVSSTAFEGNTHDVTLTYAATSAGVPSANVSVPFTLATPASEVWLETKWIPPSNVAYREAAGKLHPVVSLGTADGAPFVEFSLKSNLPYNTTQGVQHTRLQRGESTVTDTSPNQTFPADSGQIIVAPVDYPVVPGTNAMIRLYAKMSTTKTSLDGLVRVWVNQKLVYDSGAVSLNAASNSGAAATFSVGRLGGVHEQGYDASTTYRHGSLKVFTTNPGWV